MPDSGASAGSASDLLLGQRLAIVAALAGLVGVSWLYLFDAAAEMAAMDHATMPMPMPPTPAAGLAPLFAM